MRSIPSSERHQSFNISRAGNMRKGKALIWKIWRSLKITLACMQVLNSSLDRTTTQWGIEHFQNRDEHSWDICRNKANAGHLTHCWSSQEMLAPSSACKQHPSTVRYLPSVVASSEQKAMARSRGSPALFDRLLLYQGSFKPTLQQSAKRVFSQVQANPHWNKPLRSR